MSGTQDVRLDLYLQREKSALGRGINFITDVGRNLVGKPPLSAETLAPENPLEQTPIDRPDFAPLITTALANSGMSQPEQIRALALIDNAAVYLYRADTTNRLNRTALPSAISAEWAQLGITTAQADEMVTKAISYIQSQAAPAPRREPPASGPTPLSYAQVADALAAEATKHLVVSPEIDRTQTVAEHATGLGR